MCSKIEYSYYIENTQMDTQEIKVYCDFFILIVRLFLDEKIFRRKYHILG